MQISELVILMDKISWPPDKCDYFLLHTIVTLLDLAVGNEDLPSSDMVRAYICNVIVSPRDCTTVVPTCMIYSNHLFCLQYICVIGNFFVMLQ